MNDINFKFISEQQYIVLVIETIPQDSDGATITRATCLVLMRTKDTDVYSRAGALITLPMYEDMFQGWLEAWERKTITIV